MKQEGDREFLRILDELQDLHKLKGQDYGSDDDPLANLRASVEVGIEPWKYCWARAKEKVRRMDAYCNRGTLSNEGVEETLKDIASCVILVLRLIREQQ